MSVSARAGICHTSVVRCIIKVVHSSERCGDMKTATLNMRVDPSVKEEAERVYAQFGMNLTDAVNVFLHKSIMEGGLPFDLRQPRFNAETELAMREARDIAAGRVAATRYASAAQAFADVDDE